MLSRVQMKRAFWVNAAIVLLTAYALVALGRKLNWVLWYWESVTRLTWCALSVLPFHFCIVLAIVFATYSTVSKHVDPNAEGKRTESFGTDCGYLAHFGLERKQMWAASDHGWLMFARVWVRRGSESRESKMRQLEVFCASGKLFAPWHACWSDVHLIVSLFINRIYEPNRRDCVGAGKQNAFIAVRKLKTCYLLQKSHIQTTHQSQKPIFFFL